MKNELIQAMIKSQIEIEGITRSKFNPAFKSKYIPIWALLSEIKPILNANGLLLCQLISPDDQGRHILLTKITHTSGEEITSTIDMSAFHDKTPQKFGGCLTYFRRYALVALLGIVEEDDDANSTNPTYQKKKEQFKLNPLTFEAAEHDIMNVPDLDALSKLWKENFTQWKQVFDDGQIISLTVLKDTQKKMLSTHS